MSTAAKIEQNANPPQRANRHFRIKSNSKQKILLAHAEALTARSSRKGSMDETKRMLSESRNKKCGSVESTLKIRLAREELQRKTGRRSGCKKIEYEGVKTDEGANNDEGRLPAPNLRTLNLREAQSSHKISQIFEAHRRAKEERVAEARREDSKGRRERGEKGKYRCRVNQYIFDHSRKKSGLCSKEQETIDQFWKNVNESLILVNEAEEESKDLRDFVEHITTQ